ncbi:hypothetical protein KDK95_22425 [Actinospica sp. MGRD01-02]|uniref:Uncharacterized protein n=1 Tax=Actinospica acidithermotolerans TaxID=2828514 RepID=A0A941IHZ8_9ACTN|nr:hypothetical protein [Actinospica acidithermotolerans]MBR7829080.1 hypothetical protein [Actinospica acidithermotolerans]
MFEYRCTDGHRFQRTWLQGLLTIHLGLWKYGRCPVDGRWRRYRLIRLD